MRYSAITICFLLFPLYVHAQTTKPCEQDSVLAYLDFWLGEWEVFDQQDNLQGTNKISRILNGCVIEEEWTGSDGSKGMSLFFKNPKNQKLKQVWVTEYALFPGGTKEKDMVLAETDKRIRFQGNYPYQNVTLWDRTTLTKQSDDVVRQVIEVSQDEGKTWQTNFTGIYRRKK